MEKKFYIQPQTELMQTASQSVICVSVDNNPTDGMQSETPARQVQGLKYLI